MVAMILVAGGGGLGGGQGGSRMQGVVCLLPALMAILVIWAAARARRARRARYDQVMREKQAEPRPRARKYPRTRDLLWRRRDGE